MTKKLYIAAPWVDRTKMPEIAAKFESYGHTVTHKWWLYEGSGYAAPHAELAKQALADYFGVVKADVAVLINSSRSEGKAVEQGIAIALEKPIVAVGKLGELSLNVFHHMSCYSWVDTVEEAVQVVTTGKGLWSGV